MKVSSNKSEKKVFTKKTSPIWRMLGRVSILVIILNIVLYTFYWYVPTLKNGFGGFLLQLLDKNFFILLCIFPALLVGFIINIISKFFAKKLSFKQGLIISVLVIYSITLFSPLEYVISSRKRKINTNNTIAENYIEYQTDKSIIYFRQSDVIKFCQEKLIKNPDLDYIDSFKLYVERSDSNLRIKQEHFFLQDTFLLSKDNTNNNRFDTISLLDQSNQMNNYIVAMNRLIHELIINTDSRIYDKQQNKYVDFFHYRLVNDPIGNLDFYCYFPDGRTFIDQRLVFGL
jgi:hypothetical protein